MSSRRLPRTLSQEGVARRLRLFATLCFASAESHGVRLRVNPLLVGPSGVGKTELVRQLGADLGLPVLKFTVGDWVPVGARAGTPTLELLKAALSSERRLIVHVDELEKFGPGMESPWVVAIVTELFGLLDRHPDADWKAEQAARLKRNVMFVGSGTWQNLWEKTQSTVGFGQNAQDASMACRIRASKVIPTELSARFNADWLFLEPYTADDFARLSESLRLPTGLIDPQEAARSGRNFRYLEDALTAHAIRQLERNASVESA